MLLTEEEDKVADESFGMELLRNVRELFEEYAVTEMHTQEVLSGLIDVHPEWPWATYHGGRELTMHDLAKLLKPFGMESRDIKIKGVNRKGYAAAGKVEVPTGAPIGGLAEAWERYLPPVVALPAPGVAPSERGREREWLRFCVNGKRYHEIVSTCADVIRVALVALLRGSVCLFSSTTIRCYMRMSKDRREGKPSPGKALPALPPRRQAWTEAMTLCWPSGIRPQSSHELI